MTDIHAKKPTKLGYYLIRLKPGSALHQIYRRLFITARFVRSFDGSHTYFDLPRPATGVAAWKFITEN